MDFKEIIRSLGETFAAGGSVKTVYGDPVTAGGRTIIPVASVRYGFGGGSGVSRGGDKPWEGGGGGGGGLKAEPVGVVEVSAEGTRFIYCRDTQTIAIAVATGFLLGLAAARFTRQSD